MLTVRRLSVVLIAGMLTACVNMPTGPSVMTLPGSGKNFDQFRRDEYECREYAYQQAGERTPRQVSQTSGVESAAIGTGLGAAAGAALGGGHGAAIGAGIGLLMGGLIGSGTANASGYASQRQYDIGYIQCMYAKGHRVPIDGRIANDPSGNGNGNTNVNRRIPAPSQKFIPPPPPPGSPPPPPSR